jgi:hypothetical protein
MPSDRDTLYPSIRKILLDDWDPHNAAGNSAAHPAYDGYIPPLLALLRSHPLEEAVVDFLHEREKESMCFPSLGTQRLRRVARKLLDVNTEVT